MKTEDEIIIQWFTHPSFDIRNKNEDLFKEIVSHCNRLELENQNVRKISILKSKFTKMLIKSFYLIKDFFDTMLFSILLRLLCVIVLIYIILIMVYETDSWYPFISLIFLMAIVVDIMSLIFNFNQNCGFL
jgi:hypothetical protein